MKMKLRITSAKDAVLLTRLAPRGQPPTTEFMPKLTIDNLEVTVPDGTNVLEAARELDIAIPHFCYHEALGAVGSCRLCAMMFVDGPVKGLYKGCLSSVLRIISVNFFWLALEAQDFRRVRTFERGSPVYPCPYRSAPQSPQPNRIPHVRCRRQSTPQSPQP